MPPEVLAFMAKPQPLVAVLVAVFAVGVFVGMTAEQFLSRVRRKAWREETVRSGPGSEEESTRFHFRQRVAIGPRRVDRTRLISCGLSWERISRLGQFSTKAKRASSENSTAW